MLLLSAVGCLSEAELAYNDGVDSLNQGLYAEAISDYDKAIQLDPDYFLAYINRGLAYSHLGQLLNRARLGWANAGIRSRSSQVPPPRAPGGDEQLQE